VPTRRQLDPRRAARSVAGRRRLRSLPRLCALTPAIALIAFSGCGGSDGEDELETSGEQGVDVRKSPAESSDTRPNIVVVVTDDQTLESFNETVMPRTTRMLVDRGTTFSQGIVATPQCCPSRAGYLTGQYSQNNGVTSNRPGYPLLRDKPNVLPGWLQAAGYETLHVGKYLNGYTEAEGLTPGPGWNGWMTLTSADYQESAWSIDGVAETYDGDYLTRALNGFAVEAIRRQAGMSRPFYLQVDHLAPHDGSGQEQSSCQGGAIPDPRDADAFPKARSPRNPATRETALNDKPEYLRRRPAPEPADVAEADRLYGCALRSLASVDRGVSRIVSVLRQAGELGRTMIVFTSDNGSSFLEHRVPPTKGMPYEEHLRVPFVIRPPRDFPKAARSGGVLDAPTANVDLAPTILELADARPCLANDSCRRMDGRSLLPLLRGEEPRWTRTRAIRTGFSVGVPTYGLSCEWDGLRTPRQALINHVLLPMGLSSSCEPADEFEYYDLKSDPFQLRGDRPIPPGLKSRLDRLRRCSGIEGRDGGSSDKPFCE
jgi:arylsulfatase A-like enzyme